MRGALIAGYGTTCSCDMTHVCNLPWLLVWPSRPLAQTLKSSWQASTIIGHKFAGRHRQSAPNVGSKQQQPAGCICDTHL